MHNKKYILRKIPKENDIEINIVTTLDFFCVI